MSTHMKNEAQNCHICMRRNITPKVVPELQKNVFAEISFETWCLDTLDPLPLSGGNKYVVVCVDVPTSLVVLEPVPDASETICKFLLRRVISYFGMFRFLLTDCHAAFRSSLFKRLMSFLKVKKLFTSPRAPSTNGAAENKVKLCKRLICKYIDVTSGSWSEFNYLCQFILNSSISQPRGFSPYALAFAHEPINLLDMQISRPRLQVYQDDEDYAVQLLKEIFTTYHISSKVLLQERGRQAEQFNKGCTKVPLLSVGSVVYIKDDTIKPGTPKGSLQEPYKRRMANIRLLKVVDESQVFLSKHPIFSKGMEKAFPSQTEPSSSTNGSTTNPTMRTFALRSGNIFSRKPEDTRQQQNNLNNTDKNIQMAQDSIDTRPPAQNQNWEIPSQSECSPPSNSSLFHSMREDKGEKSDESVDGPDEPTICQEKGLPIVEMDDTGTTSTPNRPKRGTYKPAGFYKLSPVSIRGRRF
ncbi:hypothetical protein QYM36_017206 [Artemia franciscana]|uniref:Integrase catalytic domain-containing protein n=1 Tax=Artemia franciscana TaxID=6661 RepID=A0AA88HDL4_ARTSF|nr:hypothetical protein QYM36_017206 [Artemia franciscana]